MGKVKIILLVISTFITLDASVVQNPLVDRNLRIVGGTAARAQQFPHAVGLILYLINNNDSFCGGSIIHPTFILTAAHCFDDAIGINVIAGAQRIWSGSPPYSSTVLPRDMRPHPNYDRKTLVNDIGLLFLLRRIPFNNGMQSIALPARTHANNRFVGSPGTVIGWGRTTDDSQKLSNELRFVTLPILGDQRCIDVYNQAYPFFQPSNICISGARGSTCNGDSGGGMHLTINGRMSIIGIVSYGSAKCDGGYPPVMTRVTSYLDWIASNAHIRLT